MRAVLKEAARRLPEMAITCIDRPSRPDLRQTARLPAWRRRTMPPMDNRLVEAHRSDRITLMPTTAAEIDAAAFEEELRSGRPLAVLDVRDHDAFAAWHLAAAAATILNVTEDDVTGDLDATVAALPADRPVRVICNVGNMSLRVAALLGRRAADVRSVRGGMVAWSRVLQASAVPLPGPFTVVQFRRE